MLKTFQQRRKPRYREVSGLPRSQVTRGWVRDRREPAPEAGLRQALRGGPTRPRSPEQGPLWSDASQKAECRLRRCFTPRPLRAITALGFFLEFQKGRLFHTPWTQRPFSRIFTFLPKGPASQARQLRGIDPVTRADFREVLWAGRTPGVWTASRGQGVGGGRPRAACAARSSALRRASLPPSGCLK